MLTSSLYGGCQHENFLGLRQTSKIFMRASYIFTHLHSLLLLQNLYLMIMIMCLLEGLGYVGC